MLFFGGSFYGQLNNLHLSCIKVAFWRQYRDVKEGQMGSNNIGRGLLDPLLDRQFVLLQSAGWCYSTC